MIGNGIAVLTGVLLVVVVVLVGVGVVVVVVVLVGVGVVVGFTVEELQALRKIRLAIAPKRARFFMVYVHKG